MISRGQEVLICQPFAHVVALEGRETVCDGCMRMASEDDEIVILKKCSGCKAVYYCRVQCQRKAWTSYHRNECKNLKKVSPKIPTDTVRLMARIIFKLKEGGLKTVATLPDGSERYFEDLMTHRAEIVKDSKRLEAFLAFFAVLEDYIGNDLPPKTEVLDIFGRVVTNTFNIMNDDYQNIGVGLYLEASIIDHSCIPNANVVFSGCQLHLRAIENIQTFSDVRISYTNLLDFTDVRKSTLRKQYYFDCDCKKCLEDDEKTKKAIRCSSCQNCVPISTMICVKCGAKEDPVRKKKYLQLSQEFEDLVIKNKGGHPEPDDQAGEFFTEMQPIFHPNDKMYLDLLEILYEQLLSKGDYRGTLEANLQILQHYHRHYPPFDINTGLMEMKAAKLCLLLDNLDEAKKHILRGKDILEVTHGKSHQLITERVRRLEEDLQKGKEEKYFTSRLLLNQKGKLSKYG